MSVVNHPPSSQQLSVYSRCRDAHVCSSHLPWFLFANEMDHVDTTSEMSVGRLILVARRGSAVVSEAKSMPSSVRKVFVEQPLICSIETCSTRCKCLECPVIVHTRRQHHDSAVENVWPPNIGCSGKGGVNVEELIWSPQSNNIGVNIDNLPKLMLPPEVKLCERESKI